VVVYRDVNIPHLLFCDKKNGAQSTSTYFIRSKLSRHKDYCYDTSDSTEHPLAGILGMVGDNGIPA
jgi:hypothetical protein